MSRWLLLVTALALGASGCASPPLAPRSAAPGAPTLSVASYNVEAGRHDDRSVIEAIGAGDADVVCLQETTPEFEPVLRSRYGARYPHQRYQHNAPRFGPGGLAVLSRFPVVDRGHRPSPNRWHPAWHVEIETPNGPIQILLVHLRAKMGGRSNDLAALLTLHNDHLNEIRHFMRWTSPDVPTLVVGDFNEESDGAAIRWLEARGFQNALPLFRPGAHTWRYPMLGLEVRQRLDHILFDRGFLPLDARVLPRGSSDHLPVVARFQVATRDPRWAWRGARRDVALRELP